MDNAIETAGLASQAGTSIRIALATMSVCCILYPLFLLGVGHTLTPYSAEGSLVYDDQGDIAGSELLAQGFSSPGYFWPRPSAAAYNAAAAGGSNLSPASPELRNRARVQIARFGVAGDGLIPADLVSASGSGLDPHITLAAAKYQADRVASARGLAVETVTKLLEERARRPGGALTPEPLINVLLVNMELDRLGK